jgi:phosphate-selective porin OprO/OprP
MNFNKKLAVAVSSAVLLMAGQVALADSATDIVDALVSKGVLTEEEGKLITKGHTSKTAVTPVVKEKDGAFTLESANGRNSISLTGRMHLDYRFNDGAYENGRHDDRDTASLADQFELRRARLGVKGKFANDFKYEIVGNLPGTATIDVAYLDWAKYDAAQLRVGKFKQPFGLEQLTSSNNIALMERSYVDQTVPAKKVGFQVMGAPKAGFTYALSTFQPHDTELNVSGGDKASGAARGTINFAEIMGNKEMIMHVGLSGLDESYTIGTASTSQTSGQITTAADATQRGTISSFRTPGRGLNNAFRGQVNGELCNASIAVSVACASEFSASVKHQAYGLEGIFAYGPFKLAGEYSAGDYEGRQNSAANLNQVKFDTQTYYVEGGWFITGEKYASSYKNGVFSSFKPTNDFDLDNGKWGAVEALFRFEGYNVDSVSITQNGAASANGGRIQGAQTGVLASGIEAAARTYTGGIRWILNPNVVIKANYSYTRFGNQFAPIDVTDATGVVNDEKLLSFRTQFMF